MPSFYSLKSMLGVVLLVVMGTTATVDLQAQTRYRSLWDKRDDRKAFLFRDIKARNVGDNLTIAIIENTDVANSDSRGMSKATAKAASGGFSYGGFGAAGDASASIGSDSVREFDGDTNFSSDRQFIDRFSVTVIDTLPNGNMLVSGSRELLVEGDSRKLVLTGIVRGDDIRSDNSVRSSNVANLKIRYQGTGQETKFVNQGWLGKRLNKYWPF